MKRMFIVGIEYEPNKSRQPDIHKQGLQSAIEHWMQEKQDSGALTKYAVNANEVQFLDVENPVPFPSGINVLN